MDKNLNKIYNLFKFNLIFSEIIIDNELYKHSPDYILEKYNRYIGFEPNSNFIESDIDKLVISTYEKIWKSDLVKRQILYLSKGSLNLLEMVDNFERYIGPVSSIKEVEEMGLHRNLELELNKILNVNSNNIKIILRQLKLNELVQ
jgi:hypothetical protein